MYKIQPNCHIIINNVVSLQKWYINANIQCFHGTHIIIGTIAIIFLIISILLVPFVGIISCGYLFKVRTYMCLELYKHYVAKPSNYIYPGIQKLYLNIHRIMNIGKRLPKLYPLIQLTQTTSGGAVLNQAEDY